MVKNVYKYLWQNHKNIPSAQAPQVPQKGTNANNQYR
jgi:hypothetical protein